MNYIKISNSEISDNTYPNAFIGVLQRTEKVIYFWERLLVFLACVATLTIMVLVSCDALLRYLFSQPIGFTADVVIRYLLPVSVFFTFSFTYKLGGHVSIDAIALALPRRLMKSILAFLILLSAILLAISAYKVGIQAHESWNSSLNTGGVYSLPIWPSEIVVPIGFGLLSVRLLHSALVHFCEGFLGMEVGTKTSSESTSEVEEGV